MSALREVSDGVNKERDIKVFLRDNNPAMVSAWEEEEAFGSTTFQGLIEVSMCH